MEFKPKSEITKAPIENPFRLQVIISGDDVDRLRVEAAKHNTTVSEIVRTLIAVYLKNRINTHENYSATARA